MCVQHYSPRSEAKGWFIELIYFGLHSHGGDETLEIRLRFCFSLQCRTIKALQVFFRATIFGWEV